MATMNAPAQSKARTHEGGKAVAVSPLTKLRRSVLTCLLWDNTFYEQGDTIAARIVALVAQCKPEDVAAMAIEARSVMQIRHAPLLLVRELARIKGQGTLVAHTLAEIIQRPDELTEYLAIYWKDGRCPISAGSKRGLSAAFAKFSRYQIAKYRDDDKKVKLSDVLRVVRPKAANDEQNETYRQLRKGELAAVDTWESELSAGKGKKETFERLISEKKLGALAALRNLRNMQTAGVSDDLIRERLAGPMPRVWPYRYVVAAKYAPTLEDALEGAMFRSAADAPMLRGKTGLLIDVSGSMDYALSDRSKNASLTMFQRELGATATETSRIDVAAGLAILLRERAEQLAVATFSQSVVQVAPRRGFALRDAIKDSQPHGGTYLKAALDLLRERVPGWATLDRLIVITDEQSHDGIASAWSPKSYLINVASYEHGVGDHAGWQRINGWSERVFDYLHALEAETAA